MYGVVAGQPELLTGSGDPQLGQYPFWSRLVPLGKSYLKERYKGKKATTRLAVNVT